ncbi:MAG TPA: DUF2177 family protein [Nocardioidaceae bacterium]
MTLRSVLGQYLLAMAVFLALDMVWLTLVAPDLYDRYLGDLLADEPNVAAAVLFYAIFVAGLLHFVVRPALEKESARDALVRGAAFGLVTYATWDLTSLAVIEGFPVTIAVIDMTWGAVLAAGVSTVTYHLWRRLTTPRS